MLTEAQVNPDQQLPMPFQAASDYAQTVMAWAQMATDPGVVARRDVAYGVHHLHRYNVFSPAGPNTRTNGGPAPIVIFWHGGGWTNGYRDYNSFMARHITALGCVLVSPSYRLVTEAKFPAAFDDAMAVVAHIRQHGGGFGGDPARIYLAGHSAGGHLAALVALRSPTRVQGCLPISGILDLHHPSPAAGSLEERVYTLVLSDAAQDAVMSPICWTPGNRVPFDLTVGEHDSARVRQSNRRMLALLRLQNAGVTFNENIDQSHFDTHTCLYDAGAPWYARLLKMIEAAEA